MQIHYFYQFRPARLFGTLVDAHLCTNYYSELTKSNKEAENTACASHKNKPGLFHLAEIFQFYLFLVLAIKQWGNSCNERETFLGHFEAKIKAG